MVKTSKFSMINIFYKKLDKHNSNNIEGAKESITIRQAFNTCKGRVLQSNRNQKGVVNVKDNKKCD